MRSFSEDSSAALCARHSMFSNRISEPLFILATRSPGRAQGEHHVPHQDMSELGYAQRLSVSAFEGFVIKHGAGKCRQGYWNSCSWSQAPSRLVEGMVLALRMFKGATCHSIVKLKSSGTNLFRYRWIDFEILRHDSLSSYSRYWQSFYIILERHIPPEPPNH